MHRRPPPAGPCAARRSSPASPRPRPSWPRTEVVPAAVAGLREAAASPTPRRPSRRTTTPPPPSPTGSPRRADARQRRGRRGAHRERRRWPATRACAPRCASGCSAGDDAARRGARRRRAVRRRSSRSMGGLMAERVTDLRDIERRVTARLVGEPEPGVPTPRRALGAGRRGPRARRHRRSRPRRRGRAGHREGRPDQPHRDHRPPARHPLRRRGRRRCARSRGRHPRARRRHDRRRSSSTRTRPTPPRGSHDGRGPARALESWTGPGAHRRRHPGQAARQRRRRRLGARRGGRPGRGRRAVPHRAVLPRPHRTSRRSRSRPTSTREVLDAVRRRAATSWSAPSTPGSDKPIAFATHDGRGEPRPRRPRPAAVLRQPGPAGAPARRASRWPPSRPAPRPG